MKKTKKATSILEAMIVLLIIIVGITGLYSIFNASQKLSDTTKNRIEAIEIAREGIEAMKNIRDTNWLMFGGDKGNCFNTFNYDPNCVGNHSPIIIGTLANNTSYIIYQNNDYKWYLTEPTLSSPQDFTNQEYRDKFRIYKENGYYSQTGSTDETIFTREIQISYSGATDLMNVKSIVSWADSSKEGYHTVKLDDLLTNWDKD